MGILGLPIDSSILIGGVTSILLSLAGFAVGQRVSKENADRELLRSLYQDLYAHFRNIRDAVNDAAPLEWLDFRKGDEYVPLVRELERSGRLALLPKRLGGRLMTIETAALKAGSIFKKVVTDEVNPLVEAITKRHVKNPAEVYSGRPYLEIRTAKITMRPGLDEDVVKKLNDQKLGVGIETSVKRGRTHVLYFFREKMISGTMIDALTEIGGAVQGNATARKAATELDRIAIGINSLLPKISKRIRDPHPLVETLIEAIPDIFRG